MGFGAGVIQVVPIAKSFSWCLIVPVAAFLALLLDQKSNSSYERINVSKAVMIGLLTGFWAALFGSFFDVFITFITKSNDIIGAYMQINKMIAQFPFDKAVKKDVSDLLQQVVTQIRTTGFSFLYTVSILLNNFIFDTIFGVIGGLLGMKIINTRNDRRTAN